MSRSIGSRLLILSGLKNAHGYLIPTVLKTVLRKCEPGETCETGEIFLSQFSITCVFSICYESVAENESYLRSQTP